jgi:uncharacterized protein
MEFVELNYLFFITLFIFFIGGLVKGTIGVGLPAVILTLLSFLYDIKDSISFILIPIILTNLYQLLDGKHLRSIYNQTKFFLISSVIFIIPGFFILRAISSKIILLIIAGLLITNSSLVLLKKIITFKNYNSFKVQSIIGAINGITAGTTSIYVMPFVFLIQSLQFNKEKLIQFMGLTFFLYSSFHFILFYSYSMIDNRGLFFSLIACAPIFLGVLTGKYLRKILSEKIFKNLFNYMLLISGIIIIVKNII